jgi:hypothetical protein
MGELVTREDLRLAIENLDLRLTARIDSLTMRLTIRLGIMLAAAVTLLGTLQAFLAS